MLAAYRVFDKDDKGYISVDDIKHVLQLDDIMDKYVVKKIVKQVDEDGDGRITFENFKYMMYGDGSKNTMRKGSGHSLLQYGSISTSGDEHSYLGQLDESASSFGGDNSVFSKISEKITINN